MVGGGGIHLRQRRDDEHQWQNEAHQISSMLRTKLSTSSQIGRRKAPPRLCFRALVEVLLGTGARISEALSL